MNRKLRPTTWAPVLLWMAVIFTFSTQSFSSANTTPFFAPLITALFPDISAAALEAIHILIRKLGHWAEYLLLGVLLMRAQQRDFPNQPARRRLFWSIAIATLYGGGDEIHQAFVPSREASSFDTAIDSLGAICGSLWYHFRTRHGVST